MRYISHRTGDLELRKTQNLVSGKDYLEVVEWLKEKDDDGKDYCYTIAIFEKYDEGYLLKSVGDRILLDEGKWEDFGILVRVGFNFLSKFRNTELEDKNE